MKDVFAFKFDCDGIVHHEVCTESTLNFDFFVDEGDRTLTVNFFPQLL